MLRRSAHDQPRKGHDGHSDDDDMDDIEAVCSRLILIDQGTKLFDGSLSAVLRKNTGAARSLSSSSRARRRTGAARGL